MTKKAKVITGVVAVVLVGSIVAFSASKKSTKAVEVRVEKVEKRDLTASVTASGQVRPQTKVDVASDITGKIVQLKVREGQMVSKGQFLLEIDAQQAEAAVDRATAGLQSAKASEIQARANRAQTQRSYERSLEIKQKSPELVSDEQLEQLRTGAEVAAAVHQASTHQVGQAEATLKDARQALGKTKLFAPMAGRVTRLNVEAGETAIMGTLNKDAATLLTISDMSVLETRVKVDETDVARIHIGDPAEIQIDAFPDTLFAGRVTKISNSSVRAAATGGTDQAVDYEVTIQLMNAPAETRPDFSATAKIVTAKVANALSVPIIALTVREDEAIPAGDTATGLGRARPVKELGKRDVEGVFIVGADNKVTFRPVKVGIAGEKHFEVLSGLKEGEKIVAGTYQAIRELKDGALIREAVVAPKKPVGAKP
ncbi:MAG TPA: efflux RND transporter periplasmic adaptor subunit [Gemmatimonadaceae bacterium]|nr:efflux RND transporter periplasmic adaptor subunit [Gemmatimonadaceae bacterium]